MPTSRHARSARGVLLLVPLLLAACRRGGDTDVTPGQLPSLAVYAAQRIVVTPTARVTAHDTSALVRAFSDRPAIARGLDDAIAERLRTAGLAHWILPADLQRAYERNRVYATDPYQLAVEPIRASAFEAGRKYGEPLSSQLRTMIALQENARYVLLPIELRWDAAAAADGAGGGYAALRVGLLDPRTAEARWVATLTSDAGLPPDRALAQVAERLVEQFIAP